MVLHPVPSQKTPNVAGDECADTVGAVYELRAAAVEHGKALAETEREGTPEARDHLIDTTIELESKTVAALDECSENADHAATTATEAALHADAAG